MNGLESGAGPRHVPVLSAEVLNALAVTPGQVVVDATVGAGGHSRLLAERVAPSGRLIGLDQDAAMLDLARPRLQALPVTLVQANFDCLRDVLDEQGVEKVDAVLADLGFCSDQLDDPERGLSFNLPGPLDMRLDPTRGEPASVLLKRLSERDLANLVFQFGESTNDAVLFIDESDTTVLALQPLVLVRRGIRPRVNLGFGIISAVDLPNAVVIDGRNCQCVLWSSTSDHLSSRR